MPRRDDVPRDMLFGLLALQNSLVTRDQLALAFGAWTGTVDRTLADILVEYGAMSPSRRALLDALVTEHLAAHGHSTENSLAAIDPSHAIREGLTTAGGPHLMGTPAQVGLGIRSDSDTVGTSSAGQRFHILRPHARGGLGAVHIALDTELRREVALKQILDDHADDPASRARFLSEAEITGSLEHPGIVPVYGLGTYDGGRPYYAMRFVKGDSLGEAIKAFHRGPGGGPPARIGRRTLELRQLLRRFVDVCNAVEYAHSRGILHRDLKPSNVIVGEHGETLVVDWGLAKAVGEPETTTDGAPGSQALLHPSVRGTAETLPGQVLGTPGFMSPEQAAGESGRLGPRSDVYSLGATLYCLLTGKAPFEGEAGEVMRRVKAGDFPSPRRHDATIDRALEVVCLKAMTTAPEGRYASYRALAEDVERWMADEPVSAWREPWTWAILRWLTQHRTGVTGTAVAGLAVMAGLAAVAFVQTWARGALEAKNVQLRAANARATRANAELEEANAKVQARYDLAVEAIRTFHTGVSEDFLLKQSRFQELRDRLLGSATDFYERLGGLLRDATDLPSRRGLLQANFEVAELAGKVGRKHHALALHRRVLAGREALAAEPGADPAVFVDVARSLAEIAGLLHERSELDEAEASYRRAEALLAESAGADPVALEALAACRSRRGVILADRGDVAAALEVYRLARADQEALADAPGASREVRNQRALTCIRIGWLLSNVGRRVEALAEYRDVQAIYRRLATEAPDVVEYKQRIADIDVFSGTLLSETGRPAEALRSFEAARAIRRGLADAHPAVNQLQFDLAISHRDIGNLLDRSGRLPEAEAAYRQALEISKKLLADDPSVVEYRTYLAINLTEVGRAARRGGRAAEALGLFREAAAVTNARPTLKMEELYNLACWESLAAGAAADPGSSVSAGEAAALASRAVACLRRAVAAGFRDLTWMRTDSDLDPLRGREDFRILMMDLAMPAEPFAAAR